jgi:hypothetical protein
VAEAREGEGGGAVNEHEGNVYPTATGAAPTVEVFAVPLGEERAVLFKPQDLGPEGKWRNHKTGGGFERSVAISQRATEPVSKIWS